MIMREKFVKTTWFVLLLLSSLTSAYVTDEFVRFLQEQSALNRNETSQSPYTGTLRVTSQEVPSEASSSGSRLNALCRHQRLDLLFVLDGSKSVKAQNFQKMLEFTSEMAGSFAIGRDSTQVAVMQYSGCIRPHIYLNDQTSVRELQSVILGIKYEAKGTATGRALRFASHKMFSRRKGARDVGGGTRRTMIFITDGKWAVKEEISDAVRQLEDKHVERFAIGIGKTARSADLSSIASNPVATHHRYITDYVSLTQVRQDFLQEICREEQPCQDGNIDVINATGYDVLRTVGMETKVGVNRAQGSNDDATAYGVRPQTGVIVLPARSLFKQRLPRKFAIISIFRMLAATPHISWNLLEFVHRNGNVTSALKIAGEEEEVHYVMHDIIGGKHTVKFQKVSKLFRPGYHKVALYVSHIQASLYIDCSSPEHRPLSALPDRNLPDGDIAVARDVVTRDSVAVDIQQLWIVCSATYQSHSDVFDCCDVISLPGGQVRFPQHHVIASTRSQPIEETPRLGDVTGEFDTCAGTVKN
ncbi:collagen alpha-1(XXI) chain-like [Clavelina lepadiformis]|uniref:collagen alpha-1(XXI) chain-like n=1 Tax=Clavelina lepadiformis TaxID=159417 RepID=UPI004041A158